MTPFSLIKKALFQGGSHKGKWLSIKWHKPVEFDSAEKLKIVNNGIWISLRSGTSVIIPPDSGLVVVSLQPNAIAQLKTKKNPGKSSVLCSRICMMDMIWYYSQLKLYLITSLTDKLRFSNNSHRKHSHCWLLHVKPPISDHSIFFFICHFINKGKCGGKQ